MLTNPLVCEFAHIAAKPVAPWLPTKPFLPRILLCFIHSAENVRKLKGGKPGQVLLSKEDRVVTVRPEDSLAAAAGHN